MKSNQKPTKENYDLWHNDSSKWKLGFFYFNREDPRLLPPKRNPMMGWTVNFANPKSWLLLFIPILIVVVVKVFK
jgi:uncharacterized membrane protein